MKYFILALATLLFSQGASANTCGDAIKKSGFARGYGKSWEILDDGRIYLPGQSIYPLQNNREGFRVSTPSITLSPYQTEVVLDDQHRVSYVRVYEGRNAMPEDATGITEIRITFAYSDAGECQLRTIRGDESWGSSHRPLVDSAACAEIRPLLSNLRATVEQGPISRPYYLPKVQYNHRDLEQLAMTMDRHAVAALGRRPNNLGSVFAMEGETIPAVVVRAKTLLNRCDLYNAEGLY